MAGLTSRQALNEAFAILRRDSPADFAALSAELAGLTVDCRVGDERLAVRGGVAAVVAGRARGTADATAVTDRATILDLIDGDIELLEAVMAKRLRLIADVKLLIRLSRAQRAFASGAARCRRMRFLLDRYRAADSRVRTAARSYSVSSPR